MHGHTNIESKSSCLTGVRIPKRAARNEPLYRLCTLDPVKLCTSQYFYLKTNLI